MNHETYGRRDLLRLGLLTGLAGLSSCSSEKGKMVPSRITNVSRSKQLELSQAIKRARFLGLMSYTSKNSF